MSLNVTFNKTLPRVTLLTAQEMLSLVQCLGRILASNAVSSLDVPGLNNPAMDGYTMCLADIASGQLLPTASKSLAGQPYHGEWPTSTCIRVITGAPVPGDCEAVVMQEQTEQTDNGMRFAAETHDGQDTRRRGEDIPADTAVFPAGIRPTTAELPAITSLGAAEVPAIRKARVALLPTGNKLQLSGQPLDDGQIHGINRLIVHLMLERLGCEIINLGIIRGDPHALCAAFIEVDNQADVVISSGGASVGEAGYTETILGELGETALWKLAVKPGKPFTLGKLFNSWFCGLPGNPVSATLAFYQLVQPLLARLSGNTASGPPVRQRVRVAPYPKEAPGRPDFRRDVLQHNADDELEVTTAGHQDSHMFGFSGLGNYFIVLERNCGNVEVGEQVGVEPFNALFEGL